MRCARFRVSGKSNELLFFLVMIKVFEYSTRLIWNIKTFGALLIRWIFRTEISRFWGQICVQKVIYKAHPTHLMCKVVDVVVEGVLQGSVQAAALDIQNYVAEADFLATELFPSPTLREARHEKPLKQVQLGLLFLD